MFPMEKQKAESPSLLEQLADSWYTAGMTVDEAVQEFKKQLMMKALRENRGNLCRTARAVGHHRNTVSRLLEELKLREFAASCRQNCRSLSSARDDKTGARDDNQPRDDKPRKPISAEHRLDQSRSDRAA
jgi:hypothetical protein